MGAMIAEFWAVLDRSQRLRLGGLFAVFVVNALFEFLSLGVVFALAVAVMAPPSTFGPQRWLGFLSKTDLLSSQQGKIWLAVAVVVAFLLKSLAGIVTTWLRTRIIHQQNTIFAERLLRNYLAKDWHFFLRNNPAVLTAQITGTCNEFTSKFINGGAVFLTEACVCLALLAGLACISPVAMLVLGSAMVALIAALHRGLRKWMYFFGDRAWAARMGAARIVEAALQGAKEVKLYRRSDAFCAELSRELEREGRAGALAQTLNESPRQIIEFSALAGFIGFLALEAAAGYSLASIGVLASVFATAGFRLLPAAGRLASAAAGVSNMQPYFDRLRSDLVIPPAAAPADHAEGPLRLTDGVELRSLFYRYPDAPADALAGISVRIPKGSSLGIVGRSGSGKTTLMELLLGVLLPTAGDILIDGRPLDPASCAAWQSQIGYVPQHIFLTDDTVARNIAFGIPAGEIDIDRVREAARLAGIAEFIEEQMPAAYQTEIGTAGMTLSGGQRQRVVIARALYRRPQVLIFDEATSALDQVTENIVNEAIARLQGERTIIIVAHRLSSVRHCEEILVLDRGRLVQSGRFEDLSQRPGTFQMLVHAQAQHVAEPAASAQVFTGQAADMSPS
jgi:ATP-binding cassette subfamily C protein